MLIRGNAAARAFIYWRDVFGTSANSAFTDTSKCYAHETRLTQSITIPAIYRKKISSIR